ncbi:MRE11 [Candida oxycetoniae]|uniref:Double-strand break repair protein n=1 Tax=Candida oxycetoniae TaxID=497107 RepID=A0AAI9WYF0_9ASCO|nr:MRE11 [Candida oxycetoniae]KAI3404771.2 MRE11 [Candida oxycetoniae]
MPLVDKVEDGEDTIKVLLTTDNHVGCFENDPIRGDDGWKTFDEITQIARDLDVDMMIQGGDLFHINKPSKKSIYHVMKSLRANCMGDKPCELELLNEPADCMSNGFDEVNYEDPNLNISIPVFAISGNHDDATGEGLLSALDVLAVCGLLNYFGKVTDTESITVKPILLQKGTTKLALYGMSNVRDERLHRSFRDGGVKFERSRTHTNDWFNLFVIHQNHALHTYKSSIPENFLPSFLDFVLWGHEHECIPHPVHNPETEFDVLQAGSSIATSLSEGEVPDKKVFIIRIKGKDYSLEAIDLKTVRPFILRDIVLSKTDLIPGKASKSDVIAFLVREVESVIERASNNHNHVSTTTRTRNSINSQNGQPPMLPLVRLRVEYSGGYEIENVRRFSNQFVGRIANVNDVVQFYKKKTPQQTDVLMKRTKFDADLVEENLNAKKTTELALQDIVSNFLKQTQLALIPEAGLNEAVKKFVENDDKSSLSHYINNEIKKETKILLNVDIDDTEFHGDEKQSKNMLKQILMQIKSGDSGDSGGGGGGDGGGDGDGDYDSDSVSLSKTRSNNKKKRNNNNRSKAGKSKEIISSEDSEVEVLEVAKPSSRNVSRNKATQLDTYPDDDMQILSSNDDDEYYPQPAPRKRTTAGTRRRGR